MVAAPVIIVAAIKSGRPDLWAGFMEHAGQTPSFTNWRWPAPGDLIKMARTIPAILFIAVVLVWRWRGRAFTRPTASSHGEDARPALLLGSGMLIAAGLSLAVLSLFAADWVLMLAHFQPLIVGVFLMLETRRQTTPHRWLMPVFAGMVLLVSVRAIGMSIWGTACSLDVSYSAALQLVRAELDHTPPGSTSVMSTAFLYEAAKYPRLRLIHEDWTHRIHEEPAKFNWDTLALIKLKPANLVLTQFDFYRRYQPRLAELATMPELVTFKIINTAHVRAPDSFPRFRQVVQHVSWAPVIVEFDWK